MRVGEKKITVEGLLRLIGAEIEVLFPLTRRQAYRQFYRPKYIDWGNYFPSIIKAHIQRLERKGAVQIKSTPDGWIVTITEKGKKSILIYDLDNLTPKNDKWDGKWRLVFFDISEVEHKKRDMLRKYLIKLGMQPMQESVFVSPFDIEKEVKYIREVLEIPHGVKLGMLDKLENDDDLKDIFGV